jgi:hypothetical protein
VTTTLCPFVLSGGPTGAPLPTTVPAGGVGGSCARTFEEVPASSPTHDLPGQLLLAYRIPAGATAPGELTTDVDVRPARLVTGSTANPIERRTVTFTRSTTLERQVAEWYEAPAQSGGGNDALPAGLDRQIVRPGEQLVAYISDALPGPIVSDFTVATSFGLPSGEQPFAGPFRHLTLAGWRLALTQPLPGKSIVPGTASPARAPSCRTTPSAAQVVADLQSGAPAPGDLTVCPLPAGPLPASTGGASTTALLAGTETPTRDLVVIGGAGAAEQGTAVSVPFTLRGVGPAADEDPVGLRAFGGVPGSTPAPRRGKVAFPAGRNDTAEVLVGVPPDTAPGTYDVGLRAVVGDQTRTGVAKLTVVPRQRPYEIINPPQVSEPRVVVTVVQHPGPVAGPTSASGRTVPPRERLVLTSTGTVPFGYICPETTSLACRSTQATLLISERTMGYETEAGRLPLMLRVAQARVQARASKRVRAKLRLSMNARTMIDEGADLNGLLVIRPADDSPPQVRRVVISATR